MQIISKDDARASGLRHYFTGKPCKRGGLAPRRVNGGRCTCDGCRAHIAGRVARYKAENPEKERRRMRKATKKRYWNGNREEVMARAKATKKAVRQRTPVWFGEFDRFVLAEAVRVAGERERATGSAWHVDHLIPLRASDATGLHCGHNVQVIPAQMNQAKSNQFWLTTPDEWLRNL